MPITIIQNTGRNVILSGVSTTPPHNSLRSLQGGQAGQYYHLSQVQFDNIVTGQSLSNYSTIEFSTGISGHLQNQITEFHQTISETPLTNFTLSPAGTPEIGTRITYHIKPTVGIDLLLGTALLPSDSTATFPKALTVNKLYIVQLTYGANGWMLTSLVGGY